MLRKKSQSMTMTASARKIAKVLIVDDCARMRQEIRATVDDLVEEFIEAADGGAAIASYLLHKPDWVTMDIAMSPMDGLTAAREIKTRDPLARILVVTAYDTSGFRAAAQASGACAYIRKDNLDSIRNAILSRE
jgi:two-component system, chemotaxis family, chemotaxis protein CheY